MGILVGVLSAVAWACASAWAGDPLNRDQQFDAAWNLAWQIQDQALRGTVLPSNPLIYPRSLKVAAQFNSTRYSYVEPGSATDLNQCMGGAVAVTVSTWMPSLRQNQGQLIYLCPTFWEYLPEAQAQTLIHEAAHWAGYQDECVATAIEIFTMDGAGRIPFRNGYIGYRIGQNDRCGYAELFPYRRPRRDSSIRQN